MNDFRKYGEDSCKLVLVHGGPGAPGGMAPVAKVLSSRTGVLEPFQTKNSVAGQIEELKSQITNHADVPVTLLGWSWGAWLALFVAAEYPDLVSKLIMVSSGPLEAEYAKCILGRRLEKLTHDESEEAKSILEMLYSDEIVQNRDGVLSRFGQLMTKADFYCEEPHENEVIETDSDIHKNVWEQAADMRKRGELLECISKLKCPLTVIHGKNDSHPFEGLKNPLDNSGRNYNMVILDKCGHYPWYEKYARDEFFSILLDEI